MKPKRSEIVTTLLWTAATCIPATLAGEYLVHKFIMSGHDRLWQLGIFLLLPSMWGAWLNIQIHSLWLQVVMLCISQLVGYGAIVATVRAIVHAANNARNNPNQASDATEEPAPGAGSSAHQG